MMPGTALFIRARLVSLAPVDGAIVVFHFALVLSIGWYLQRRADTGEDLFMAGSEMTASVAGLSFLSPLLVIGALYCFRFAPARNL
jgi:uncharacterized BrkB/YihY/UPF0761 family membrane protein